MVRGMNDEDIVYIYNKQIKAFTLSPRSNYQFGPTLETKWKRAGNKE